MFGYYTEKSTNHVLGYWDLKEKPANTDEYEFFECAEENKPDVYRQPMVVFNLDALDAWLLGEEALKSYTGFFPIISRASEKNTVAGYQLMVMVAQSQEYNIPQNIIDLVVNKLSELGAKIQ